MGCLDVRLHAIEMANTKNSDIGVLHLFWGIRKLMVKKQKEIQVLSLNGTDSTKLEIDLLQYTGNDLNSPRTSEKPVLTQSAKDALTIAIECAKQAGATEVTPSHLLLGIIKHVESIKQRQT